MSGPTSLNEGSPGIYSLRSSTDPAPANRPSLRYSFSVNSTSGLASSYSSASSTNSLSFTFPDHGSYTVFGRAYDNDGGESTIHSRVVNVSNVANAGFNQTVDEGDLVTLNGTFTDVGLNDGHKQEWSVVASNGEIVPEPTINNLSGDSNGSGGSSFHFTPGDNGTYWVIYKVTDDDGGVPSDTAEIIVDNVAPSLTIEGPTTVNESALTNYTRSLRPARRGVNAS